jgi:hypothetical protein
LATLASQPYKERQNNYKQPLWQNGDFFHLFVNFLSQFSEEGDLFWSQKGGKSVAKVNPFCQKTNHFCFITYFPFIMLICKQKKITAVSSSAVASLLVKL